MDNDDFRRGADIATRFYGGAMPSWQGRASEHGLRGPVGPTASQNGPSPQLVSITREIAVASGCSGWWAVRSFDMESEEKDVDSDAWYIIRTRQAP